MKRLFAIFLLIAQGYVNRSVLADISTSPTSVECGQLNEEYLSNGKNITNLDEFPWIARIAYKNVEDQETVYHCQGVLISKRYVISTAHCYVNQQISAYAVVLGDWDASNNITEIDCTKDSRCAPVPKQYDIEKIILHPSYRRFGVDNDIALLRLSSEVIFSDYIQPICLPTTPAVDSLLANHYHLAGFGRKVFNEDIGLQKFKTMSGIISLELCRELMFDEDNEITDNCVCTFCKAKNDLLSGSPLMEVRLENLKPKNFVLIGILSKGVEYCSPDMPQIYTRISPYLDWIKNTMIE